MEEKQLLLGILCNGEKFLLGFYFLFVTKTFMFCIRFVDANADALDISLSL
jgi:hypothetical protein